MNSVKWYKKKTDKDTIDNVRIKNCGKIVHQSNVIYTLRNVYEDIYCCPREGTIINTIFRNANQKSPFCIIYRSINMSA